MSARFKFGADRAALGSSHDRVDSVLRKGMNWSSAADQLGVGGARELDGGFGAVTSSSSLAASPASCSLAAAATLEAEFAYAGRGNAEIGLVWTMGTSRVFATKRNSSSLTGWIPKFPAAPLLSTTRPLIVGPVAGCTGSGTAVERPTPGYGRPRSSPGGGRMPRPLESGMCSNPGGG